ncbi:hypothetical protein BH10PSE11_BH10PSE11_06190 [soil metagenome]
MASEVASSRENRIEDLLAEAQKFCASMGLRENLIREITWAEDDWTFILKIDALLETAAKEIIRRSLKREAESDLVVEGESRDFIDSLPINGRTSIVRLLKDANCPSDDVNFIESVRRLRNSFAHNIRSVDQSLIEVIKQHQDKSRLIKDITSSREFSEEGMIRLSEGDGYLLRFAIADATMSFLTVAYQIEPK